MRYVMGMILLMVATVSFAQKPIKVPPLSERLQIYEQLSYMTDRDFAMLPPGEKKVLVCVKIGEKIDIQLDYERHGSSGVYNMDALRHAGPDYCRPYLMAIH